MRMIWQKYFIKETLKTFAFVFLGFFIFAVLIDFSSHFQAGGGKTSFPFSRGEICIYYGCMSIDLFKVMIPFSLMLATIRTLISLNQNNEWTTLLTSGISQKQLLRPFLLLAIVTTIFLYLSQEAIEPTALKKLRHLNDKHVLKKKKQKKESIYHVAFENGSTLIYNSFDSSKRCFSDVFWVESIDEIYHMKYLYPDEKGSIGEDVAYFLRNQNNDKLALSRLIPQKSFPEIAWNPRFLLETVTPIEERPLTELHDKWKSTLSIQSEKDAKVISVFYKKLILPWLALLAVLAPAPFCLRLSKQIPMLRIYAFSIFCFFGVYLILDAGQVLGERQVLSPIAALFYPSILIYCLVFWRYLRT